MLGLAIALALVVALAFTARRVLLRLRYARLMRKLPGGSAQNAVPIAAFDEIDEQIHERRCPCGGRYEVLGEGSRAVNEQRLRIVRVECGTCERETSVHFDVTGLFH